MSLVAVIKCLVVFFLELFSRDSMTILSERLSSLTKDFVTYIIALADQENDDDYNAEIHPCQQC